MLEDFGKKKLRFRDRLPQIFSFVIGIVILALGVNVLISLNNYMPRKQKREFADIILKSQELLKGLEVAVIDAGYYRKSTSTREIYVPALVIQIINVSYKKIGNVWLSTQFMKGEQSICGSNLQTNDLMPGEDRHLIMKCSDFVLTGTVLQGIGLIDAEKGIEFELSIQIANEPAAALQSNLPFKLL